MMSTMAGKGLRRDGEADVIAGAGKGGDNGDSLFIMCTPLKIKGRSFAIASNRTINQRLKAAKVSPSVSKGNQRSGVTEWGRTKKASVLLTAATCCGAPGVISMRRDITINV